MSYKSRYKPEYAQEMLEYFYSAQLTENIVIEEKKLKDGSIVKKYKEVGCNCPLFEVFARRIGVSASLLSKWAIHPDRPEFKEAYEKCLDVQRVILIQNGLSGLFNPIFMRLAAVNMMRWRDAKEVTNKRDYSKVDDKDLQNRIASKKAKVAKNSQIVNNIMDNVRTNDE